MHIMKNLIAKKAVDDKSEREWNLYCWKFLRHSWIKEYFCIILAKVAEGFMNKWQ